LYCHGITNFAGPCPGCSEALSPGETKLVKVKRADPLLLAQGNYYLEFSSSHPHV
jgi:hypothetical protein